MSMLAYLKSLDQSLFWFINSHHNFFLDYFFSLVASLGTGWVIAPVLLFFIAKEISRKRISFILFSLIIMIASGLINSQIKHCFRTPRPAAFFAQQQNAHSDIARFGTQSASARTVHFVGERLMQNSFPSGHSNTAFAAATLLTLRFGGIFWPAYPVACLVGYSRVYMGAHFPSDVIAGGLLGFIVVWIGLLLYNVYEKRGRASYDQR